MIIELLIVITISIHKFFTFIRMSIPTRSIFVLGTIYYENTCFLCPIILSKDTWLLLHHKEIALFTMIFTYLPTSVFLILLTHLFLLSSVSMFNLSVCSKEFRIHSVVLLSYFLYLKILLYDTLSIYDLVKTESPLKKL